MTLLCAFAGGCLSNAVLFGVWRLAERPSDTAVAQQRRSDHVAELTTAASTAEPNQLVATTLAPQHDIAAEAAPAPASDPDNAGPAPAGSAVSDVLARLETEYRENAAPPAPPPLSAPQDRAAPPVDSAVDAPEAASNTQPQAVAAVVRAAPPVAVAMPSEPPPAPPAPPAGFAPPLAAEPAIAAQDAPPVAPVAIHYGDVNQNTYITNVREGDVYQVQLQQVAMLQYLQLLGASSGVAAPPRRAGNAGNAGRQRGTLTSGIINPDNPWGFHVAPPHLVR